MKPKGMRLRIRDEAFLREYCSNGGNATQAMLKVSPELTYHSAGLIAHKIVKSEAGQAYINKYTKLMEEQSRITRQLMEDELFDLLANCKNDDDRQHIIKTLDMMNKLAGHYNHKKELDVKSDGVVINFIKPDANN